VAMMADTTGAVAVASKAETVRATTVEEAW
jgi:hypothetical protein